MFSVLNSITCHLKLRYHTNIMFNNSTKSTSDKTFLSQTMLKMYGKSDKSSLKPSSLAKLDSCVQSSRKSTSLTVISQVIEAKSDNNLPERSVNLTKPLPEGLIFAIVLPYLLDNEKNELKQPILIKIKESEIKDFGFELPFSFYNDQRMNCFKLRIESFNFHAEILATGDSPLNLKVSLRENIETNSKWKDLPKMKRLCSGITSLQHCPLESENDIPSKRVLSDEDIEQLFQCSMKKLSSQDVSNDSREIDNAKELSSLTHKQHKMNMSTVLSGDECSQNSDENLSQFSSEVNKRSRNLQKSELQEKGTDKNFESRKRKKNQDLIDKSAIEVAMDDINDQIDDLVKRKKCLSEYDSIGSFLISIINVLADMRQYIDLKNQYKSEISNCVPEKDLTYKIVHKNQIYLEGLIRIDLDLYEEAIRNSVASKAPSFAYQIVKIAFPAEYYEKVTLGKKVIAEKVMERYLQVDPDCDKTKYPLSFIWGFEKPYEARMQGKFDYQLGQKRLRSFINHIFRKAKIYQYSAAAEYSVRSRIIKELCAKNTYLMKQFKNSEREDSDDDTQDQRSTSSQEQTCDTWDVEAFES